MKIAIDGPAGAGKSTVAKMVASQLGYLYIDTGAMYRAIAWLSRERGVDINDRVGLALLAKSSKIELVAGEKAKVLLDGKDISEAIRMPEISQRVGLVSAHKDVRAELVRQQQDMARSGNAVLDGRDIGTVVLPDAEVKVFLTASPEERARRRLKDITAMGLNESYEQILAAIIERDTKDTTREESPLRQAEDAILIDTDTLAIDQVVQAILDLCANRQKTIKI